MGTDNSSGRKSPNTGQMDEAFNQAFDFGEGETQNHPMETITTSKHHKKIDFPFIFAIVIGVVLIIGYRIVQPKAFKHAKCRQ